jgi:hypothetical protein
MNGLWISSGNLLAVFLTLAIFSFLYKDNPFYRFAEHFFVGIAAGYFIVIQYHTVFLPNLWQPFTASLRGLFTGGEYSVWGLALIVPFAMGLLMFAQLIKRYAWLSRWPMAVVIGSFSGLALLGNAQGDLIPQIKANMLPFLRPGSWSAFLADPGLFTFLDLLWNPVLIIGVITVLIYFFFSKKHEGAFGAAASLGLGFLMISFGAAYGNTVMTRISLLIERFDFLVKPEVWRMTVALLGLLIVYFVVEFLRDRPRRTGSAGEG